MIGFRNGIYIKILEAGYGQTMQLALNKKNIFNMKKGVDAILLSIDQREFPYLNKDNFFNSNSDISQQCVNYLKIIKKNLQKKYNVPIIFQTIPMEETNIFGNYELNISNSMKNILTEYNSKLFQFASGTNDYVLDVASLAEKIGLSNWHDQVSYNIAKVPFSPDYSDIYANNIVRIISAILRKTKKVLVLDLDNTIWGGEVGDAGINNIKIGNGDPEGEAFSAFQKTLLNLKNRGIILAVCSKNNEKIAKSAFKNRRGMILQEKDFAIFKANWLDKPTNIKKISEELNLGLDTFVFVDDNPVERDIVRKHLPEVSVPELSKEATNYPRDILVPGYFEIITYSKEDKKRSETYHSNIKRKELEKSSINLNGYLKSLNMKAKITPFKIENIDRITQLILRTNQFNLTTKRYKKREIEKIINNRKNYYTLQSNLEDEFGDNGIVSLIIGKVKKNVLLIDTWVMSCRVFSRNLEYVIFKKLISDLNKLNIKNVIGEYFKTEKNNIVHELYRELEFKKIGGTKSNSKWIFDVKSYTNNSKANLIKLY